MSLQIAGLAPATRVMSRKLGPTWRQRLALLEQPRGGLRGEHVRKHVRQVAEHGHEPVVGLGVDGHGPRAERRPRSGAGARRGARRTARAASGTRPRPGRGRRARAPRRPSRRRRSGGRRRSAGRASRLHEVLLGRADVGDERVRRPPRRAPLAPAPAARRRARRRSTASAPSTRLLDRGRGAVDRAALAARSASRSGSRPKPTTSAPSTARCAARPIDPPIRPTPRTAIFTDRSRTPCRRAPPPPRPCAGSRRTRRRAAPAGRRRSPPRGTGGPRR